MRGYGASLTKRTGKCKCENPKHSVFTTRITQSGELVISVVCNTCKALWDTKAIESRKYLDSNRKDCILADTKRKEVLQRQIERQQEIIQEAQKEVGKMQKELEAVENRILSHNGGF